MIKFRGFRKDGTMLIGDLNHIYGYLHIFPRGENAGLDSPDNYEIVPESLSMFTGLTDKNGKEIFGSIPIDGVMSNGGDLIKKTGEISHTIFWNQTKRSSGKEANYKLNGYGIFSFDLDFINGIKWKLIKCEYDEYNQQGTIFHLKQIFPIFSQIRGDIEIIGNQYEQTQ